MKKRKSILFVIPLLTILLSVSCNIKSDSPILHLVANEAIIATVPVNDIKIIKNNHLIKLTQMSQLKSKARRWYNLQGEESIREELIDFYGLELIIKISLIDEDKGTGLDYSNAASQAAIEDVFFYDSDYNDLDIHTKLTDYETKKNEDGSFTLTGVCYIPTEVLEINAVSKLNVILALPADGETYSLDIDIKSLLHNN